MNEQTEVQLPPPPPAGRRRAAPDADSPPKIDGRSKEARAARAQERSEAVAPTPNEVRASSPRAEATRRERRRRENVDKTRDMKLGFRFTPDKNYEYRWINEGIDNQRLKDLTIDDDWEAVSATGEPVDGAGSVLRRAVGESKSGPQYAVLCRKPKDWYDADHRKGQARNDKLMSHIRQGKPPTDISKALKPSDHVYGAEDIKLHEHGRTEVP